MTGIKIPHNMIMFGVGTAIKYGDYYHYSKIGPDREKVGVLLVHEMLYHILLL